MKHFGLMSLNGVRAGVGLDGAVFCGDGPSGR